MNIFTGPPSLSASLAALVNYTVISPKVMPSFSVSVDLCVKNPSTVDPIFLFAVEPLSSQSFPLGLTTFGHSPTPHPPWGMPRITFPMILGFLKSQGEMLSSRNFDFLL